MYTFDFDYRLPFQDELSLTSELRFFPIISLENLIEFCTNLGF